MSLKLTHKVLIPYAFLILVIMGAFYGLHRLNQQVENITMLELSVKTLDSKLHALNARIQSGILTRQHSHTVGAARTAHEIEALIHTLGQQRPTALALSEPFQAFFVKAVSSSALFMENREADGAKRLEEVHALQTALERQLGQLIDTMDAERRALAGRQTLFMLSATAILVLLMGGVGVMTSRQVVAPIARIARKMREIAQGKGDLTTRMEVQSHDEVGAIAIAFNDMNEGLRTTIAHTAQSAEQVSEAANGLVLLIKQVEKASQTQQEAASAMAAAVEELTASVSQVADMTKESERSSTLTCEATEKGVTLASESSRQMKTLTTAGERASQLTEELIQESSKIQSLVGTIHEIADQTNLLALNAAIEAARAGETGRGFAVVADEVRKLAERTNTEATRIRHIVEGMSAVVSGISETIRHNTEEEQHESETSQEVRQLFKDVGEKALRSAQCVRDIANAMKEQSAAAYDIAHNVESVAQMAEHNTATVEEVTQNAQSLSALALDLRAQMGKFRF